MKTQSQFNRPWPLGLGLLTITITLALAANSVSAGKPPKPPPEPESGYRLVNLVGPAGGQSVAWRINDAGWVVGQAPQPDLYGPWCAFVVIPEDTDSDGEPDLWARDDNGDGLPDCWFIDENDDGVNDLAIPLLPLGRDTRSFASAINANGLIAGRSGDDACLWDVDPMGVVSGFSLGRVNGYATGANDVNDDAQVVGAAAARIGKVKPPNKFAAWLSENGTAITLADRVVDWGPFDSRNTNSRAWGINNRGMIVGDMEWHAYIAIPVP